MADLNSVSALHFVSNWEKILQKLHTV